MQKINSLFMKSKVNIKTFSDTISALLKLLEKKEFTGMFEKDELLTSNLTKTGFGEMNFMKCVMACLKRDGCYYFKHGDITTNIDYSVVKDCTIWTT